MSLDGSVVYGTSNCFHHVTAGTQALHAELRADAALHVAPAQRQERHEAGDQLLLNDAGFKEATCREKKERTDGALQSPSSGITGTGITQAELQFTGKLAYLIDCINSSQFGAFLISICKMGLLLVNLI